MKPLAVKAGKMNLTPRIFQAPEKLNVQEVCASPRAFTNCIKIMFMAATLQYLHTLGWIKGAEKFLASFNGQCGHYFSTPFVYCILETQRFQQPNKRRLYCTVLPPRT